MKKYIFGHQNKSFCWKLAPAGKPYWRGRIRTVDLLVLTSLDQLLFKLKLNFLFLQNNLSLLWGQLHWAFPFSNSSLAPVSLKMVNLFSGVLYYRWQFKNALFHLFVHCIDFESLQNRLLKVCYVPATSTGLPRVSFFFSFLFLLQW